jgi:hypothetical protein
MAQSRIEALLEALVNGETSDIVPRSRNEAYLKALVEMGMGGGSAPVVILQETELTYDETEGGFFLLTPWMVDLVAGGVYDVTYNGVKYECDGVPATESGLPADPIALGNVGLMGLTGGNTDAPFALMCFPNEGGAEMGMYAMLANTDDATSVTISIVQIGEASEGSGSGGGVTPLIVNIVMPDMVIDKPYSTVLDALNAGIPVQFRVSNENFTNVFHLCEFGVERIALALCNFDVDKAWAGYVITPDGKVALA